MKTPDIQRASAGPSKQKTQLTMLAGLALVLVLVLVKQFGSDEAVAQAATASSAPTVAVAANTPGPAETGSKPSNDQPKANPALAERPADEAVANDAFHEFWQPLGKDVDTPIEELPPPKIKLNATLVPDDPDELRVAVIDGKLKYIGDNIQGWWLHSIDRRAVALRSPGDRIETIAMPLLQNAAAVVPRRATQETEAPADGSDSSLPVAPTDQDA